MPQPLFNKVSGLRTQAWNFIKKRLWHRCFAVNFANFSYRTSPVAASVNSISIYSWKMISLLTNIRSKRVIRKINLYFLTSWKMALFFHQVCHFQYEYRCFFRRETGNIRAQKEVHLKMKSYLGRVFPSIFCKMFWWKLQMKISSTYSVYLFFWISYMKYSSHKLQVMLNIYILL